MIHIHLIEKTSHVTSADQLRPIGLCSAMQKLYISTPLILSMEASVWDINVFGFIRGAQAYDMLLPLQLLVQKTHEWNRTLYALKIDVRRAFDSMCRSRVVRALLGHQRRVDPILARALLAAHVQRDVRILRTGTQFELLRGGIQGSPETPTLRAIKCNPV